MADTPLHGLSAAALFTANFASAGPTAFGASGFACTAGHLGRCDQCHGDEAGLRRFRTIFISNLHLGTPRCQATPLLDVLKAHSSDNFHQVTLKVNRHLNTAPARMGLLCWSLSAYFKQKVKSVLNYVTNLEVAVAQEAKRCGHDGVVCGHIHRAEMRDINSVLDCNDSDWIESRAAKAEHFDGPLQLLHRASESTVQGCQKSLPEPASKLKPLEAQLKQRYPQARWLGVLTRHELATCLHGFLKLFRTQSWPAVGQCSRHADANCDFAAQHCKDLTHCGDCPALSSLEKA